jgi:hypothetical protein
MSWVKDKNGLLDTTTLNTVMTLANRAPSIHNSQPWRWRLTNDSVRLFADNSRLLPATDPDGRDLILSCAAALHHLRIALAVEGWGTTVHRMPNPTDPDHLATVEVHQRTPLTTEVAMASAIRRRRTDRRRFTSWPVPAGLLDGFADLATAQGVVLVAATEPDNRFVLASAIAEASIRQEANVDYAAELATWTGRSPFTADGVPATNIPAGARRHDDTTMRAFPNGQLTQPPVGDEHDAGELLVLATANDDRGSQLRAGEALSAVLLTATDLGLATCPLSQVLEVPATRELVRTRVLDGFGFPQIVVRVGWPPVENAPLPATPRRPFSG